MSTFEETQTLHQEVVDLVTRLFEQARRTDRQLDEINGYSINTHLSTAVGSMQYYVFALAALAGCDEFLVKFILERDGHD